MPARAAFATGRPVHQISYWDNATPYDGREVSWHHTLRQQRYQVFSIGKLHFSGEGQDHGFSEEQIPLHVLDGKVSLPAGCWLESPSRPGGIQPQAAYRHR